MNPFLSGSYSPRIHGLGNPPSLFGTSNACRRMALKNRGRR